MTVPNHVRIQLDTGKINPNVQNHASTGKTIPKMGILKSVLLMMEPDLPTSETYSEKADRCREANIR